MALPSRVFRQIDWPGAGSCILTQSCRALTRFLVCAVTLPWAEISYSVCLARATTGAMISDGICANSAWSRTLELGSPTGSAAGIDSSMPVHPLISSAATTSTVWCFASTMALTSACCRSTASAGLSLVTKYSPSDTVTFPLACRPILPTIACACCSDTLQGPAVFLQPSPALWPWLQCARAAPTALHGHCA
ncbi:hypothetical protein DL89DRAFT_65374 [Linderina pennispora]|uniref:Uncharacterized protein n=1 Tax=Linderina pennispora TaxID=61395 RepID=A0A1Y1VZA3_9FUNG|nr:uncharacterized protein DL89DRAFT_65374 [Linderina pennispora]ORX66590.1 hypothetical protein DL89DRAFT_65374 [Linderina pennispora]